MKQYQPLYLKYRPQKLSELVGQEVVSKSLSNAIQYNKIVHAYLFCGPRGTGKTSTARILAKSLNCESGITVEPCGKCTSCQSITNGNSLDVIEIDAASHRKVEDAENLISRVGLGTYGSRFKIYIIDEVHMLTDHAFNALLKTIEEPPKNVIFILATTEEYKVIPTIVSRCQRLEFKPIAYDQLEARIKDIAMHEKININNEITNFIAKRSGGCLRDAISLLDQISILQTDNKPVSTGEVFELFGTVDKSSLFSLMEAVLLFDTKRAIDLAEDIVKSGKEIGELFKSLTEFVIELSKAKLDQTCKKSLCSELGKDLSVLDKVTIDHLLKIVERLQDAQSKIRFALSQELQFMVEIMSMLDKDFLVSYTNLKERIEKLEGKRQESKEEVPKYNGTTLLKEEKKQDPEKKETEEQTHLSADKSPRNDNVDQDSLWQKIVSLIESNPTKTLLMQSESYFLNILNNVLEVGVSKDMFLPRLENDARRKEMILKAAKLATGQEINNIKFKVIPRQKTITDPGISNIQEVQNDINQSLAMTKPVTKQKKEQASEQDDFSKTVGELLGAKQID